MKISQPKPKGPGRGNYRHHHGNKPNNHFRLGITIPPFPLKPYSPIRTWNDMSEKEQDAIKAKLGLA